jgi:hypothetical protein
MAKRSIPRDARRAKGLILAAVWCKVEVQQ